MSSIAGGALYALGWLWRRLALVYVDQNPVRAGLAGRGTEYPWSSARSHVARKDSARLLDLEAWRQIDTSGDWADVLGQLG